MTRKQISLEQLLQCAVVASWQQLMPAGTPVLMRVDYHPGGDAPLELVKVWASTERGYWSLVCEYRPRSLSTSPAALMFCNGYHSDRLLQVFAAISQEPNRFVNRGHDHRDGFLLLQDVTPEQCSHAQKIMTEALLPVGTVFATSATSEGVYADA